MHFTLPWGSPNPALKVRKNHCRTKNILEIATAVLYNNLLIHLICRTYCSKSVIFKMRQIFKKRVQQLPALHVVSCIVPLPLSQLGRCSFWSLPLAPCLPFPIIPRIVQVHFIGLQSRNGRLLIKLTLSFTIWSAIPGLQQA